MSERTPGNYYREKAELAHALRDAIRAIEVVKKLDGTYPELFFDATLRHLRARLEMAEYVGD